MNSFKLFQLLSLVFILSFVGCTSSGDKEKETPPDTQEQVNQAPAPPAEPQTPEEFVKFAFMTYRQGVVESNANLVMKHMDENTIQYYSQLLDKTINAGEKEIKAMYYPEKSIILGSRALERAKVLRAMDGRYFLDFATQYGLLDKGLMGRLSFGEVSIDEATGATAKAQLLLDGEPAEDITIDLKKEGDIWMMNLTPLIDYSNRTQDTRVKSTTADPDERLMQMVKAMSPDGKVPDGIWRPLPKQ